MIMKKRLFQLLLFYADDLHRIIETDILFVQNTLRLILLQA